MRDKNKFDWLDNLLTPQEELAPPPYGWTRLRARLQEKHSYKTGSSGLLKLAYPVVFFVVISSALIIGQELSKDYLHLNLAGKNTQNQLNSVDPVANCCTEEFIQTSEILK